MTAFYNENDPKAAAWLRELIKQGHIAPGIVDERSIVDIRPSELEGYIQCHFFAGIGVWSYALRAAGWNDDRPVWTGSCPCQPFSAAGKGLGIADERHLWPAWEWLIANAKPRNVPVYGEQVASKDGLAWLDLVCDDLEGQGNTVVALDTCSAGTGAPHIRQRLRFMAYAAGSRIGTGLCDRESSRVGRSKFANVSGADVLGVGLADPQHERSQGRISRRENTQRKDQHGHTGCDSSIVAMANTDGRNASTEGIQRGGEYGQWQENSSIGPRWPSPTNGFWGNPDWLLCRDGKWRPVEAGTFPLVNGAAARVGLLRGYGNAVDAQATIAFIEATQELSS